MLADVDQELLELLWVLRHIPPPWPPKVGGNGGRGGFHEIGPGADDVEDFHRHELHEFSLIFIFWFSFVVICEIRGENYFTSGNPSLPRIAQIFTDFLVLIRG